MYSKKSWGGSVDPFIQVMFKQNSNVGDEKVSLVIFEYNDKDLIGIPGPDHPDSVCLYPTFVTPEALPNVVPPNRRTTSAMTSPWKCRCAMPPIKASSSS